MSVQLEERTAANGKETARLQVGRPAPGWDVQGISPDGKIETYSLKKNRGKWAILFFYPLDFTPVCATEVEDFKNLHSKFKELNVEIFGASIDSVFTHKAWIKEKHGGKLPYPLLADLTRQLSHSYGTLIEDKGFNLRGTFIIDPDGILQWHTVNSTGVGRSTHEVLRVLQALQSGGICGVNWKPGEKHLTPP